MSAVPGPSTAPSNPQLLAPEILGCQISNTPTVVDNGQLQKGGSVISLCFDGTTSKYNKTNTNVVKLYSLLKKNSEKDQLCYYQPGVGTYIHPGYISPIFSWAAQTLDKAFAWYLYQHVMDGYKFLMQNYKDGDRICLFGFSRGAYTARALAGMLHKVGLLSKDNLEQIPFAYKLYKSKRKSDVAKGFKDTFSRSVTIDFVGVWDTVASIGAIWSRTLPFASGNTAIKVFRQALALDEHRAKFRPTFLTHEELIQSEDSSVSLPHGDQTRGHTQVETGRGSGTNAKEVWFVGSHAVTDVGGGSVPDDSEHALSNISLRWMIRELVDAGYKDLFSSEVLAEKNLLQPPAPLSQLMPQNSGRNNDIIDSQDSDDLKKIRDPLRRCPVWWTIEVFPTRFSFIDSNNRWKTKRNFNLGRGRHVPPEPVFHESVRTHMKNKSYTPKAIYEPGTERYER
ncbi:hypothetical protein BJV78DRAFT_1131702 [Lactifluus subvellereus]|nr:hypothetical protein BJV78DRAFT_1131702 [Lactifluus subvellereus]